MPRMERNQRWWNHSSSLTRSLPYRRVGTTTALYTWISVEAEWVTLPYSLWPSSKQTAGFGQALVKILADCGVIGDDAPKYIYSKPDKFKCLRTPKLLELMRSGRNPKRRVSSNLPLFNCGIELIQTAGTFMPGKFKFAPFNPQNWT